MLSDCKSLPASDLWALGVIMFQMHCGRVPFTSPIEATLFQKILLCDFEWPEDLQISTEAKDVIERLLKLNPA